MRSVHVVPAISFLSLAFVSLACAGGINGEVDGDGVPSFTTSAVGEYEVGDDSMGLSAWWANAGNACEDSAALQKILNDAEDDPEDAAEEYVKYWEEHLPEEFWYATIGIFAEDDDDLEEEQEIELDDPDDDLGAGLTVCRVEGYPEEDDGRIEYDQDCFYANPFVGSGTIFAQYEHEGTLRVNTDGDDLIELEEDDGDEAGEDISFSGNAAYCDEYSDELDD